MRVWWRLHGVVQAEPEMTVADSGFQAFYRHRWRDAVGWAAAMTGRIDVAEDLVQEVFLRLASTYDTIEHPDSYLYAAVANAARSWHRSEQRRARRENGFGLEDTAEPGRHDDLLAAMRRLPFDQRAVVVLRYWLDWDEASIATVLSCRRATVRTRAKRGLARLRILLEEENRNE